jgi:hypothetical protein
VDDLVALSPVTSPVTYDPADDLNHTYKIRAVEEGCPRQADSNEVDFIDENRIPEAPVITNIEDPDPCAPSLATISFTHPGFPESGHYELWRDGSPFLTPIIDGTQFSPGDGLEHGYVVRAVDDLCSLSTDSGEVLFTDGTSCSIGESRLFAVRTGDNAIRLHWTAATGNVASYNLYPGTLDSLMSLGGYDHTKTLGTSTFPDSPTPADGCDVAGGAFTTARMENIPMGTGVYLVLVAADASGNEGPYGRNSSGVDRHDPSVDPRPPSFFCP